jgi:hypothetical protein
MPGPDDHHVIAVRHQRPPAQRFEDQDIGIGRFRPPCELMQSL